MAKLYIFGIGGTGSRVLRSLTMMLASGVKFGADEIVPIIIDPDKSNADLTRNVALMDNYINIREKLTFTGENQNGFFRTRINKMLPNYTLHIDKTDNKSFRDFIDIYSMSKENQALVRMLFSEKNLESTMNVGFKGNPNIGSVVLNQISYSDDFDTIANSFQQEDRIFIISSIFGGTGASGFPLLLKTLRTANHFANYNYINKAEIGAISILPYFNVKTNDQSEIDTSTFISKTKSALAYYENNIVGPDGVDALYFLGDDVTNIYENSEGGSTQKNDAHLIEFLAATAIINFSNSDFKQPTNLELGVNDLPDANRALTFNSFYSEIREMLFRPLSQFILMANALTYNLPYYKSSSFDANSENRGKFLDIYSTPFFKDLTSFFKSYIEWLRELEGNRRSLDLFNLDCMNKPFDVVTDIRPKKVNSFLSDYSLFTSRLNSELKNCQSNARDDKFIEMFYLATQRLFNEKLNN